MKIVVQPLSSNNSGLVLKKKGGPTGYSGKFDLPRPGVC